MHFGSWNVENGVVLPMFAFRFSLYERKNINILILHKVSFFFIYTFLFNAGIFLYEEINQIIWVFNQSQSTFWRTTISKQLSLW